VAVTEDVFGVGNVVVMASTVQVGAVLGGLTPVRPSGTLRQLALDLTDEHNTQSTATQLVQ